MIFCLIAPKCLRSMGVVIADHFFLFAEEYGRHTVAGAAKDPVIFLRSSACASLTGNYRRRSELTTKHVNHQIGPLVPKIGIRSTPIDAACEAAAVPERTGRKRRVWTS